MSDASPLIDPREYVCAEEMDAPTLGVVLERELAGDPPLATRRHSVEGATLLAIGCPPTPSATPTMAAATPTATAGTTLTATAASDVPPAGMADDAGIVRRVWTVGVAAPPSFEQWEKLCTAGAGATATPTGSAAASADGSEPSLSDDAYSAAPTAASAAPAPGAAVPVSSAVKPPLPSKAPLPAPSPAGSPRAASPVSGGDSRTSGGTPTPGDLSGYSSGTSLLDLGNAPAPWVRAAAAAVAAGRPGLVAGEVTGEMAAPVPEEALPPKQMVCPSKGKREGEGRLYVYPCNWCTRCDTRVEWSIGTGAKGE